ncbi:MAG TPA: T9SS type A sorting domain-containing protein [Bacteroidota bacterium]|nr:T9SS type A sorting domain-containing protein [Bacteroidota bacterium]
MKSQLCIALTAVLLVAAVHTSNAQRIKRTDANRARNTPSPMKADGVGMIKRTDAIWARTTTSPITLDGVLNEAAWAVAESVHIDYGIDNGMPGSGWVHENGLTTPTDPTHATVKFLVKGDSLYVGVKVWDKSVGGGPFNRFDGILSNIRQKQQVGRPVGAGEIFYAWVKEPWADSNADQPGRMPFYGGFWGSDPYSPRPDSLSRATWGAATTVQGTQNNDADVDQGYTMEFRINLATFGYNVSQVAGDIVMYTLSIYDADYQWPLDTAKQAGNRCWFQCPWGNAAAYNHIRVYARPDVGLTGSVPVVGPEIVIPSAGSLASPVLDGILDDAVWSTPHVGTLQIKFGDNAIRDAYPSTAPYRSGQYQPTVNGGVSSVSDPSLATIKYFFKADTLFLGFDVNDLVVQSVDQVDRWDGFRVIICQRDVRNADNVLFPRRLSFRVGGSGTSIITERQDDIAATGWDSLSQAVQVVMALKGGTTIDTAGILPDSGYTAEMRVVLPKFGYPAGRGDGVLFLGVVLYDGDSFTPFSSSYGTRTWFMREGDFNDGAAWCYMDPNITVGVKENGSSVPEEFALLGNYPNPFNPSTTIRYMLPEVSDVTIEVFNMLGQSVSRQALRMQGPGEASGTFDARALSSGVYPYHVRMSSPGSHVERASFSGKMILLK